MAPDDQLVVGCPRCPVPVASTGRGAWACPEHGVVAAPLWRPGRPGYSSFVAHLRRAGEHPTYLPWPLGPGWRINDFAVVAERPGRAVASMCSVVGISALDGDVQVLVVSEEPGSGLGARVAGAGAPGGLPSDGGGVGHQIGAGPAEAHVRVDGVSVGLWPLSTSALDGDWDRSVLVGEAHGRWLWLVLRPASAILLLRDGWILRDVSTAGPQLVELPFGGEPPRW